MNTVQRRIVAGVDLGPETEAVVSYAVCIAAARGAGIQLLYVIDYLLTPPSYLSEYVEEEKKRDESEMRSWEVRIERQGVDVECGVVLGRLHQSFVSTIEGTAPELLVIGFKSHMMRPSSSERLVKSLRTPILAVRGKKASGAAIGSVEIRKILCPVDFSDNSRKAAVAAGEYASLFSARLDLLHVVPSHVIEGKWSSWDGLGEDEKRRFGEAARTEAAGRMASFLSGMQIAAKDEVRQGSPAEVIAAVAGEGEYDMVVIGARGLSYVESVLLGGTTESVLRSSPCPVLIIH